MFLLAFCLHYCWSCGHAAHAENKWFSPFTHRVMLQRGEQLCAVPTAGLQEKKHADYISVTWRMPCSADALTYTAYSQWCPCIFQPWIHFISFTLDIFRFWRVVIFNYFVQLFPKCGFLLMLHIPYQWIILQMYCD